MSNDANAKRPGTMTTARQGAQEAAGRGQTSKPSTPKTNHGTPVAVPNSIQSTTASPKREPPVAKKKLTYEERMRRLAPIVQVRRKLESTIKRFTNLADEVRRWRNAPDLREAAAKVEADLAGMLAAATTIPDAFQPERERKVDTRDLVPGVKVSLRDKFVARYDGVLEPAERASLEVVAATRGHVSVKTETGARIVLPRGHLTKADVE